jgi:hypothetical protein
MREPRSAENRQKWLPDFRREDHDHCLGQEGVKIPSAAQGGRIYGTGCTRRYLTCPDRTENIEWHLSGIERTGRRCRRGVPVTRRLVNMCTRRFRGNVNSRGGTFRERRACILPAGAADARSVMVERATDAWARRWETPSHQAGGSPLAAPSPDRRHPVPLRLPCPPARRGWPGCRHT